MKHLLLTTIAAVVLVGCGESQQSVERVKQHQRQWSEEDRALFAAADAGNIEAVKQHLAAGTDVNAKNILRLGRTPLHQAAWDGHKEIVELLITNSANVDALDRYRETPLHAAADEGHKEIAELLIANGADVDGKYNTNYNTKTPLHYAAGEGHKEIIELLIANGADVDVKTPGQNTALDLAVTRAIFSKHTEIVDLIRKHGGKTGEELKAEGK
jgi:ankyrin repeat protein